MPTAMSASAIARAFGLGTPARELTHVARGAMGTVFRLDTDRGPFAVKRLLWGASGDEATNAAFQFAAADAGVPLARPVLSGDGEVVFELADGWWRVYEWIESVPHEERCVGVEVAAALGRLHSLGYDLGNDIGEWYTTALCAERIDAAVDTALRHGFAFEHARASLLAMTEVVAAAREGAVVGCHRDAQDQNLLVGAQGAVLIDWDNAGPAVPEREFAVALENFADDAVPMVRAYRDFGGEFEPTDLTVFAMAFSATVRYIVNCCEHLDELEAGDELLAFERPYLDYLANTRFGVARYERLLEMIPA